MTARAFVVGHPIRHSRSPLIHGHWLAEHGLNGSYERIDVAPDGRDALRITHYNVWPEGKEELAVESVYRPE